MLPGRAPARFACLAVAIAVTLITPALVAAPAYAQGNAASATSILSLADSLQLHKRASSVPIGQVQVFIRIKGQGAASYGGSGSTDGGGVSESRAVLKRVAAITKINDAILKSILSADPSMSRLYSSVYLVPGVAVRTSPMSLKAIAARSDVVSILPLSPKSIASTPPSNPAR